MPNLPQHSAAPASARLRIREDETKVGLDAPPPTCEATLCTHGLTEANDPILPEAQRRWAARPLTERLGPLRRARHWMAAHPEAFAKAIAPTLARTEADTLVTELLPLLEAIRFLERNARKLLAPRQLGTRGRPLWLAGVHAEIHRDPLGHILVIGPANFPLFLPGVQALQALVAGNAVTWKPGDGGERVARLLAHVLHEAGLPRGILYITDHSVEAAQTALAQGPDKVIFTGSLATGRLLLHTLADTATPAVMELSGADAVVVLPSADLPLAAKAIAFGLRLNGAEVCMSPRRLLATPETLNALRPLLQTELAALPSVLLKPHTAETLQRLLAEAVQQGAELLDLSSGPTAPIQTNSSPLQLTTLPLSSRPERSPFPLSSRPERSPFPLSSRPERSAVERPAVLPEASRISGVPPIANAIAGSAPTSTPGPHLRPLLLNHVTPAMAITRTDLFAPILSLIEAPTTLHLPDLVNNNPFALTAAIFGAPREAETLATQLRVGTVLINDLIAPTADPRIPFGGRGSSGFGLTRGAEGLLEMTAAKTILRRQGGLTRHYAPLGPKDTPLFAALLGLLHAGTLRHRWQALRQLISTTRQPPTTHPQPLTPNP